MRAPDGFVLVPLEPTEAMADAYQSALKAYIESVPEAERKWRQRKTSGGIWSGYRLAPREKMLCRWRAMVAAAQQI